MGLFKVLKGLVHIYTIDDIFGLLLNEAFKKLKRQNDFYRVGSSIQVHFCKINRVVFKKKHSITKYDFMNICKLTFKEKLQIFNIVSQKKYSFSKMVFLISFVKYYQAGGHGHI